MSTKELLILVPVWGGAINNIYGGYKHVESFQQLVGSSYGNNADKVDLLIKILY